MSLLLDALKKAEKAKDEARRRARPAGEPEPAVPHVRTRDELPDISRPLEIHSEDIPGSSAFADSYSPVPDAFSTAPATRQPATSPIEPADVIPPLLSREEPRRKSTAKTNEAAPDPHATQRATAKNVFEAKFREPNPKMPFYVTMAMLGVFALGTIVYFWYQLRPPPSLVNTSAKPPGGEPNVAVAPVPAPATAPASPPKLSAIPGLPAQRAEAATSSPAASPATVTGPQAPAGSSAESRTRPESAAKARPSAKSGAATAQANRTVLRESREAAAGSKLSVNRAMPAVNPKLAAGWAAYNEGNLVIARTNYYEALRDEPANRDALLGMAALEVRANRPELAEIYYQKLLELNPRDPLAQAGQFALRAHMTDPVQAESQVKSLLANDPEAHVLYFTLGNEFAQQGRWPEAQQAYFKAFSADPENPDFAYNLAVSLDHVRQPKLALEYYRTAISLAQQRSSNFDQALARNRAQELSR